MRSSGRNSKRVAPPPYKNVGNVTTASSQFNRNRYPLSPVIEETTNDNNEVNDVSITNKSSFKHTKDLDDNNNSNARVKVVIRIRPLNSFETNRGHRNIIQTNNQQITVWDPSCFDAVNRQELNSIDPAFWSREFAFDKCLNSLDPSSDDYASQDMVFNEIGQPVLNWILNGYNCCVFAFGQTGAGKSFTMLGDLKGDPIGYGLIPRICFGMFDAIEAAIDMSHVVTYSHMEIYNENVRDLLAPASAPYLKVREHPQKGVFVSNLTTVKVTKFEDIMSLIAIGDKNRTVASTQSNAHSSRSHAIVTLTITQRSRNAPKNGLPTSAVQQKVGKVHLVDLAGSERVALSGAKGDRLREANSINKSLSVLGDVIKCLGDLSKVKNYKVHIPYRNSQLTMVLKESLGGNSHAIMISAISPSSFDYEETISTLKYADRAKRVRLRVDANVTLGLLATDNNNALQLVPILQAEVNKLREMLRVQQVKQELQLDVNSSFSNEATEVEIIEMRERVKELENQLAEREKLIERLELSRLKSHEYDENQANNKIKAVESNIPIQSNIVATSNNVRSRPTVVLSDDAIDTTLPRVINLNQDPLFSECLVYYIPEGNVLVGNKDANADIFLSGPDILSNHAYIHHSSKGEISIEVLAGALVFVNGDIISTGFPKPLNHFDRISFGRFHLFRFEGKGFTGTVKKVDINDVQNNESKSINSTPHPFGWEFAQAELMRKNDANLLLRSSSEISNIISMSQDKKRFIDSEDKDDLDDSFDNSSRNSLPNSPTKPIIPRIAMTPPLSERYNDVSSIENLISERYIQQRDDTRSHISNNVMDIDWWGKTNIAKIGDERIDITVGNSIYNKSTEIDDKFKPIKPQSQSLGDLIKNKNVADATSQTSKAVDINNIAKNNDSRQNSDNSLFEKEALALQQELTQMQKVLKERMLKYQVLVNSNN